MADLIGKRIALLIEDRRTNQSKVAAATGITQPSIGRLIRGETKTTGKLLELARALETTPEYLTGESDNPAPNSMLGEHPVGFRHAEGGQGEPDAAVAVDDAPAEDDVTEEEDYTNLGGGDWTIVFKSGAVIVMQGATLVRNTSPSRAGARLFFTRKFGPGAGEASYKPNGAQGLDEAEISGIFLAG